MSVDFLIHGSLRNCKRKMAVPAVLYSLSGKHSNAADFYSNLLLAKIWISLYLPVAGEPGISISGILIIDLPIICGCSKIIE